MRCELVRTAIAVALCAACGSDPAANGGSESAASQASSAGGPAKTASGASGSGAAGKPASSGASGAGASGKSGASGSGAKSPATVGGSTAGAGAAGTAAAAAGSGTAASAGAGAGAQGMAAAGGGAAGSAGGAAAAMTDDCDRKCLLDVMQQYLDALVAHDPTKLKTAATVKVVDNGKVAKLGDGIFKTGTMVMNDHRLDYADPVEGNVGTQLVVSESAGSAIHMARLKVVKHEVTEVETMTVRQADAANGFFDIMNMKPEAVFLQEIPADKRMPRDKLKEITEMYLDYLEGKKNGMQVPFDEGCKRYENGQVTASGLASFNAQSWGFQVTHRILIIDEEAGITWGMFPFMQSETALVVGEAFKIIEGKIKMIQAVMAYQPSKAWD